MGRWRGVGLAVLALAMGSVAQAAPVTQASPLSVELADVLVMLSGTAAVFDSSRIQAALAQPDPFLASGKHKLDPAKIKTLLKSAGYRPWMERPTLWVVQPAVDNSLSLLAAVPRFVEAARERALPLSLVQPVGSDYGMVTALAKGQEQALLPGLLASHQATALVVVDVTDNGFHWQLIQPGVHLQGELPVDADLPAVLPSVLSEALAGRYQWPEAGGRELLRLRGVGTMKDFVAAQAALQQLKGVRGLSLVRLDGDNAYFALEAPTGAALDDALAADTRLTPDSAVNVAVKPALAQARTLGSPLHLRLWNVPADKP